MNRELFLLNEDFSDFSIGDFPFDRDHSAMGEYHCCPPRGYRGAWYDPVTNYNYSGPSWIITESQNRHFMEQMRLETTSPHLMHPMLTAGRLSWNNYTVRARVRLLNTRLKGEAGVCFYYQNSLNLLAFVMTSGSACLFYRHKEEEVCLESCSYSWNSDEFYDLRVQCSQKHISCFVNEKLLFKTILSDTIVCSGKIAITANLPAQFASVSVSAVPDIYTQIQETESGHLKQTKDIALLYPAMKLWRSINLTPFGTGRQIRFGHLTGTSDWHIVLAQTQKRIQGDAYAKISCLTAIDLNGSILWQIGEPSSDPSFGLLSADIPLQVYDIDHDGCDEVITCFDFHLLILNGKTGKPKKSVRTPKSVENDQEIIDIPFQKYAFDRLNPDCVRIANFSGAPQPSDILIKDRYCRLYAYDCNLNLLWKYHGKKNTGHCPYPFDMNHDGYDELFCGYDLIDHKGNLIWTLPVTKDHTDEIIAGRFSPQQKQLLLALASGTEGFILADLKGHIIKQDKIGHAQRISCGNYRPDLPGFEICVTNFWGHQGIIYLYDCEGSPLMELENGKNGNLITPVNWKGDGSDLILLHPLPSEGGLMDGYGRLVVPFPDDGHPTLCAEAINLTGDARDELVVWDQKQMFIYTQDDNPKNNVYTPVKFPHYNASNYRGEYSFPDDSFLKP